MKKASTILLGNVVVTALILILAVNVSIGAGYLLLAQAVVTFTMIIVSYYSDEGRGAAMAWLLSFLVSLLIGIPTCVGIIFR